MVPFNTCFFVCLPVPRVFDFRPTSLVKNIEAQNSHPKCILTVDNCFKRLSENSLCPLSMLPNPYRKNPSALGRPYRTRYYGSCHTEPVVGVCPAVFSSIVVLPSVHCWFNVVLFSAQSVFIVFWQCFVE